mgnify:FL=1|jgi:hypothetical protein
MAIKRPWHALALAACMTMTVAAGGTRAAEIPMVTGEHWTTSSDDMKKAYLIGIANIVHVETGYTAENPPSDEQSVLPRLIRGLKGQTLDSVREALNAWYAAHPDQLQRPVIETLWFELVVPGLQQAK